MRSPHRSRPRPGHARRRGGPGHPPDVVARAAAALGWLSEREAWDVLEQIGARIAGAYRSWEEYGEDFALGWGYFRPLQANEGPTQLARWLASDPRSPWRRVRFGG